LILANRSRSRGPFAMLRVPNAALWWVVGGALAALAATLVLPPLQSIFRFATPAPLDLALVLAAAGAAVLGFETLKGLGRRRSRPAAPEGSRVGHLPDRRPIE
jgi:Ca2+-transporting ATPase